jgi:hypothetical protein
VSEQWIVTFGDLQGGWEFYGPFASHEMAFAWSQESQDAEEDWKWDVHPLHAPPTEPYEFYACEMLDEKNRAFIGELLNLNRRFDFGLGSAMEVIDYYVHLKNIKNKQPVSDAPPTEKPPFPTVP